MTGRSDPPPPGSGAAASLPCDATTQTCPLECAQRQYPPREHSQRVTETISNAPAAYSAWNGTYGWESKFTVEASRATCSVKAIVKIKVTGTVTEAQKSAWKSAIEDKWNGKAKLSCPDPSCTAACPGGYPIAIELRYVASGEHYTVTANQPSSSASGRAGLGGTTSMTGWGVNDTVDIAHEFGHMLGCPEEYFTTDGVDYTAGGTKTGFRDADGGIMNNPSNNPKPGNYEAIRQEAGAAMGLTCTTQAA